jgi:FtsH-binding integral membrane protein
VFAIEPGLATGTEALMDPTPPASNNSHERVYPAPTRGFAVASVAMGYFSLIVFFWKPFGMVLGAMGFTLGVISLLLRNRGSLRGEGNMAWIGTLVCGFSLSITIALYKMLGLVQWDTQSLWTLNF